MSVYFKTQQGRTLFREDLTVEDITKAVGSLVEVVGVEVGRVTEVAPGVVQFPEFHANTRHIVEWWDAAPVAPGEIVAYREHVSLIS